MREGAGGAEIGGEFPVRRLEEYGAGAGGGDGTVRRAGEDQDRFSQQVRN